MIGRNLLDCKNKQFCVYHSVDGSPHLRHKVFFLPIYLINPDNKPFHSGMVLPSAFLLQLKTFPLI
jgi:hypothetical protein